MTKYVNLERQRPCVAPATPPPARRQPPWCKIYAAHAGTFSPLMRAVLMLKIRFAS